VQTGYVAAVGSEIGGVHYEWEIGPDDGVELADLPGPWLAAIQERPEPRSRPSAQSARGGMNVDTFAEQVLHERCDLIRASTSGSRNQVLNTAALWIGHFVGPGRLDREDAETELLAAAVACGLPAHEARATIASGIAAGMLEPRRKDNARRDRRRAGEEPQESEGGTLVVQKLTAWDDAQMPEPVGVIGLSAAGSRCSAATKGSGSRPCVTT